VGERTQALVAGCTQGQVGVPTQVQGAECILAPAAVLTWDLVEAFTRAPAVAPTRVQAEGCILVRAAASIRGLAEVCTPALAAACIWGLIQIPS
jgi:hypothetical protein